MTRVYRLQSEPFRFRPDTHHRSVDAVLEDQKLSKSEKRAILSAWASDVYATESSPGMRRIPGHSKPIPIDWLLRALRRLDDDEGPSDGGLSMRIPALPLDADVRGPADVAMDFRSKAIRSHQSNIRRYNRLLETDLTQLERDFIKRRIAEETAAIQVAASSPNREGAQ